MSSIRFRQRPSAVTNQPSSTSDDAISPPPAPPPRSALSQALQSSGNLANLLPTGTVLAFQLLTPIFTNNGHCDAATRPMTSALLFLLGASCLLASFTDSVKSAADGRVHYGFVTVKGLWLFEGGGGVVEDLSKYRLRVLDVIHAALSLMVFVSVAMRDKNVVGCFYPQPGHEAEEVLNILPVGIGIICSLLFVVFPTTRHGIGYPVARGR